VKITFPTRLHAFCRRCGWQSQRAGALPTGATEHDLNRAVEKLLAHYPGRRCPRMCAGEIEPLLSANEDLDITKVNR
jgi:hypothetical protein